MVVLYYKLPLDHQKNVPVTLAVALVILAVITVWQVRAVSRAPYPALRAVESVVTTIPLFVLLFASAYFIMAGANPTNFNTHPLSRTSALYFTMTVFATVGFGDIVAVSESARLVVTVQMLLDLIVLGLVIRTFVSGARQARQRGAADARPEGRGDER
jgi:hypothetical protein